MRKNKYRYTYFTFQNNNNDFIGGGGKDFYFCHNLSVKVLRFWTKYIAGQNFRQTKYFDIFRHKIFPP